jgi:hypothetical protein
MKTLKEISNLSAIKNNLLIKPKYSYTSRKNIFDNQLSIERDSYSTIAPIDFMSHNPDAFYLYSSRRRTNYKNTTSARLDYRDSNYFKYIRELSIDLSI